MHTIIVMKPDGYRQNVEGLVVDLAKKYDRACYISFADPYHAVIQLIESVNVTREKFIVIEANGEIKEMQAVNRFAYIVPIQDLFRVYLLLRNLIKAENVQHIVLDNISTLIQKHYELPLKEMLTNLLLEVGSFRCHSSLLVFKIHEEHEVLKHLRPLIAQNVYL